MADFGGKLQDGIRINSDIQIELQWIEVETPANYSWKRQTDLVTDHQIIRRKSKTCFRTINPKVTA